MTAKKIQPVYLSGLFILAASTLWAGTATIDATQSFQFIRGFGASSAWHTAAFSNALATDFWDSTNTVTNAGVTSAAGAGFSLLRCHIPSDNPTTGTTITDYGELAVMQQAKGLGCTQIWATEWSPPANYKSNGSTINGGYVLPADYGAYAQYLLNYANMCKSNGVTLMCISPQNEPDMSVTYESGIWTGQVFHDFISQGMGPKFAGNTTKIMMPEPSKNSLLTTACTSDGSATCSLGDAAAATYISYIGTHLYGSGPLAFAYTQLNPPAGVTREYWETEIYDPNATADPSMVSGLYVAGLIHNSLVNSGMNAFHYWWLQSGGNGGVVDANGNTVKRLYVMGNWSRFVRPGSYRISATEVPTAGVTVSAYLNNVTGQCVIVAINGSGAAVNQTFTFSGISTASVTPWLTDAGDNLTKKAAVAVTGQSFTYTLPATSVVSFVGISSAITPSPTFTSTITSTPTITLSPTHTPPPQVYPGTYCLVDDFPTSITTNLWGGIWAVFGDSTVTFSVATGGSGAPSNYSAAANGTVTAYADLTCTLSPVSNGVTDLSNFAGVAFDVKGDGGTYWFQVESSSVTTGDNYGESVVAPAAWTPVTVYFNQMAQRGFGVPQPFSQTQVGGFQWANENSGAMNLQVDNVRVIGNYCGGLTPTSTPTQTGTFTVTSTSTRTSSPTSTPTKTGTPTNTLIPTSTATQTLTVTSTQTPTTTRTASMTPTASLTATPLASPTATATSQFTDTITSTLTPTTTRTNTLTQTPSVTQTFTMTVTTTKTPTATPTQTPAFTWTTTATLQFSATNTLSPTSTSSLTPTSSSTATFSFTPTRTVTSTNTPTRTLTMTSTPTGTPTSTSPFSPTNTLSPTYTLTFTSTFTATLTGTSTYTPTITNTPSITNTPTMTNTPTLTLSPTNTLSPTPTFTLTNTGTLTMTATPTSTATVTYTPTATGTPTVTGTWTVTPTLTNTSVYTYTSTPTPTGTSTSTLAFTPTFTWTPTFTLSPTPTDSLTPSPTTTVTLSPTPSPSVTPTASPITTPTPALTPLVGKVGIYPNPVTGPTVQVLPPLYNGISNVRVEVFTLAFRKVQDTPYYSWPSGKPVTLSLTGKDGNPLANGIYYVVVTVDGRRSVAKLLVLR